MAAAGGGGAAAVEAYGPRKNIIVPLPAAERGVAVVTGASANGKFFIYTNGTNVVVRDVENPELAMVYGEHTQPVKAAKFAPTGYYVASGDASGKVRVWAWNHPEHPLKFECAALGGEVEDVAWDGESKRIVAVGGGQSKAKVFSWDTGSNLGEIIPHTKKAITADFKPTRPFRMVTGGEDFALSFYAGPPFKYDKGLKEHSNFVNCVRYAPDGSRFVSVSSDKAGIVYNGETAAIVGRLDAAGGHTGGIYAAAWSPDSKALVTAGGDKSVRLWDMSGEGPAFPCTASFVMGARPEDMQQGVSWAAAEVLISTSLDGTLSFFKPAELAKGPFKQVFGHQAGATALALDRASGAVFTGCAGGRVLAWLPKDESRSTFAAAPTSGEVPSKRIAGVAVSGGVLAAAAWDDKLRIGDASTGSFSATVALGGQPKGVVISPVDPGIVIAATGSAVLLIAGGAVACTVAAAYSPTCVGISPDGATVVVGGGDKKVHFYRIVGGRSLEDAGESKEAPAAISCVGVSPDGAHVAAGDAGREVRLYSLATRDTVVSGRWMNHTTRVTGLAWSPSGLLATVSTDRRLCVWDPRAPEAARLVQDLAHTQPFAACAWASDSELWTLGTDGVATMRTISL